MSSFIRTVIFILQELAHKTPDRRLGLSIIGIIFTRKYVLDRNHNLCMAPLPNRHLAYISSSLEVKSVDLALGEFHKTQQKTL